MGEGPDEGGFESPLDELFVEGARFREPSAAERAAWARAAEQASRRRRRITRRVRRRERLRRLVPLAVLGAVTLVVWFAWTGRDGGGGGDTSEIVARDLPRTARVVYAVPSDVPADDELIAGIRTEITLADAWFASQTGGRAPRWLESARALDVETRVLDVTAADLGDRSDAVGLVVDEFRDTSGALPSDEIVVVFVPVRFESQIRCGEGSGLGFAVIWVGPCTEPSAGSDAFESGAAVVVAHELVHAMGAVEACAPNYGRNGHVTDDPHDLMYDPPEGAPPRATSDIALDPGRDDYFEHGRSDCWDIGRHPLWE